MSKPSPALSDDLLCGAKAISRFVYGDERHVRRIFYLIEKKRFPAFRMGGSVLYARKSVLLQWIEGQEARSAGATSLVASNDR
jgi:hypothetical protein